MKRAGLLNAPLSAAIAALGHQDLLVVADAGLPVPPGPARLDLAVSPGVPGFFDILDAIAGEMMIESAIIAAELADNSSFHGRIVDALERYGRAQGKAIVLDRISHAMLKETSRSARAIVRSGEFTPYANIILKAGVCF